MRLNSNDSDYVKESVVFLNTILPEPLKKGLWKQIVEAKIRNQAALLNKLGKNGEIQNFWGKVERAKPTMPEQLEFF